MDCVVERLLRGSGERVRVRDLDVACGWNCREC